MEAQARGKKAFSEETESYGIMKNVKPDVYAYDTTTGFLGTIAGRMKGQKGRENFKQQEQQQRCLNPKAKLHQGQDRLRYHLRSTKGQQRSSSSLSEYSEVDPSLHPLAGPLEETPPVHL